MRIPKPAIEMSIGIMVNKKRCLNLSDKYAMHIENANAPAQGGMEYSWVSIASTPIRDMRKKKKGNTHGHSYKT